MEGRLNYKLINFKDFESNFKMRFYVAKLSIPIKDFNDATWLAHLVRKFKNLCQRLWVFLTLFEDICPKKLRLDTELVGV